MSSPRLCPLPQGPQEPFLIAGRWHSLLCPAPGSRLASATGARWLRDVPSGVTHPGDSAWSGLERGRCVTGQLLSLWRGEELGCPPASLLQPRCTPGDAHLGKKSVVCCIAHGFAPGVPSPGAFPSEKGKVQEHEIPAQEPAARASPRCRQLSQHTILDFGGFWGGFLLCPVFLCIPRMQERDGSTSTRGGSWHPAPNGDSSLVTARWAPAPSHPVPGAGTHTRSRVVLSWNQPGWLLGVKLSKERFICNKR